MSQKTQEFDLEDEERSDDDEQPTQDDLEFVDSDAADSDEDEDHELELAKIIASFRKKTPAELLAELKKQQRK